MLCVSLYLYLCLLCLQYNQGLQIQYCVLCCHISFPDLQSDDYFHKISLLFPRIYKTDKHPEINGFPGCLFLSLVIVYPNLQFSARFFLVIMPERILLSYLPSSSMYQTVLVSVTVVHHIMLWLRSYELLPLIHRPQLRSLLMPLALPYL